MNNRARVGQALRGCESHDDAADNDCPGEARGGSCIGDRHGRHCGCVFSRSGSIGAGRHKPDVLGGVERDGYQELRAACGVAALYIMRVRSDWYTQCLGTQAVPAQLLLSLGQASSSAHTPHLHVSEPSILDTVGTKGLGLRAPIPRVSFAASRCPRTEHPPFGNFRPPSMTGTTANIG